MGEEFFSCMSDDIFEALCNLDEFCETDGGFLFSGATGGQNICRCPNCFSDEFDVEEHRGDFVCANCGACVAGILVGVSTGKNGHEQNGERKATYAENVRGVAFDSIGLVSEKAARRAKDTYKRKCYFRDRMSQWLQSEKPVKKEHWVIIEHQWRVYLSQLGVPAVLPSAAALRRSRGALIPGCHPLEKEDIRAILRACDVVNKKEREEALAMWPDVPLYQIYRENVPEFPSFTTKYLEKWISLRWRFTGQSSTANNCPAELFETLNEYFEKLDVAFPHCVQSEKRKAFPSYNETVKNLLQLLFLDKLAKDFPGLRTQRAKNKSNFYWWKFCKYYRWPYLLKDAKFLRRKRNKKK